MLHVRKLNKSLEEQVALQKELPNARVGQPKTPEMAANAQSTSVQTEEPMTQNGQPSEQLYLETLERFRTQHVGTKRTLIMFEHIRRT